MATQTSPAAAPGATGQQAAEVDPDPIMRLASGFMAAKYLFTASELGVFDVLSDSPTAIDGLAARTGLTRRAARIIADACVALGLLERDGELYRNAEVAATFLAGRPGPDLRPLLRHWDQNSYPAWCEFAKALASGPTREIFDLDEEHREIASAGIEAVLAGPANALPTVFDFSAHRRLLDVAGGTGSWTIAAARLHPDLQGTVFELPVVAPLARQRVEAAGLASRVSVVVGDAMEDELPPGHDTFLLANFVHYWSPERNLTLLQRVRRAAEPGSRLLLADFWTDLTHTQPVQAALMAGEFAALLHEGDVYSVEEVREWLPQAAWRFVEHAPLAGPQSVIVAEAV